MFQIVAEINRLFGAVYRGQPGNGLKKTAVTVNGKRLPLRFDLGEISPTGFNWGYGGAGPGQLALAVLAHAAGDAAALAEWERFREEFIKNLDMCQPFRFTENDVTAFLSGVPVDARECIRPVRKQPGWRTFWKRLTGSAA